LRYGFAVYQRLPNEADKRFVAVLRRDDKNLQALYGRAMVLVRQGKSNEAIRGVRSSTGNQSWLRGRTAFPGRPAWPGTAALPRPSRTSNGAW